MWPKAIGEGHDPEHADISRLQCQSLKNNLVPIYEDFSEEYLLQRCLGRHTHDTNESFNSSIWIMIPKHLHFWLKS